MVFEPLIFIDVPAPASPLTELTITLDALAAKEFATNASPERVISADDTETLVDPCLSLLASKPSAVTLTAFILRASLEREKFNSADPSDGTSTFSVRLL